MSESPSIESHPLALAKATQEKYDKLCKTLSDTTAQYQRMYYSAPERVKEAYLEELQMEIADCTQQVKELDLIIAELKERGLIR